MAAIFGGQNEGADLAPGSLRMSPRLERRIVVFGTGRVAATEALLLPIQINQLHLVMRQDPLTQVIEEFDDLREPARGSSRRGW